MSLRATAIRRISLPEQVAIMMRRDFFTRVYQPGDKLPSERALAEKYGISRLTLRKALGTLAQEGWIEITQGRNIVVKDFHTSVGVEVLPELFYACPEALNKQELLETIAENMSHIGEQILVAAAKKAKPADEERLLRLLAAQTADLDLEEFYENEFRLVQEILRIGNNLILQMTYNSQVKLSRRLLALGLVKDRPYPLPLYHEINRSLIKAVCTGDEELVRTLSRKYRPGLEEVLKRSLTIKRKTRS